MAQIDFYHLQKQTLEAVLPKLLEKAYGTGKKRKVKIGNPERVEFINSILWSYEDESFLPHGSKKDGSAEEQPIWLTSGEDNPNGAEFLFLVDGADISAEEEASFERVFNIFEGNNATAVDHTRKIWKDLKTKGHQHRYWQQEDNGRWKQAA